VLLQVYKTKSSTINKNNLPDQAWWHIPEIPATWEEETRGSRVKPGLDKSRRPYLKNN
jgi:hypothetical protein